MKTINEQVREAGYFYVGHFGIGELQIDFNNCRITIPFEKQYKIFDLLADIFEIDSEDGVYLHSIKGKYCRIIVDDNFKIQALQHIVKDDNIIFIDNFQNEYKDSFIKEIE